MTDTAQEDSVTKSAEAEEEAEAEAIFAEAVAAREEPSSDTPEDPGAATAKKPEDEAVEAQPGEGDGEAAAQPGKDDVAAAAPASGEDDIWAGAPDHLKAAHEAALKDADHKFKSVTGRVSFLDKEVARLRSGKAATPEGEEESEQPRKPLKELLASDELKTVAEEYPDFKSLIDTLKTVAERVDGVEQSVGQVSQRLPEEIGDEEKALNAKCSDWRELAGNEGFKAWREQQPKTVQNALERNWAEIVDAEEAAEVFESFRSTLNPKPKDEGGAPGKRGRQAQGAKAAMVTAPTAAAGESEDPTVIFAQAAAKADRARGIRGS